MHILSHARYYEEVNEFYVRLYSMKMWLKFLFALHLTEAQLFESMYFVDQILYYAKHFKNWKMKNLIIPYIQEIKHVIFIKETPWRFSTSSCPWHVKLSFLRSLSFFWGLRRKQFSQRPFSKETKIPVL